jgi:hypothetical protein
MNIGDMVEVKQPGANLPLIKRDIHPRWFEKEKYYQGKYLIGKPKRWIDVKWEVIDKFPNKADKMILLLRNHETLLDIFIPEKSVKKIYGIFLSESDFML